MGSWHDDGEDGAKKGVAGCGGHGHGYPKRVLSTERPASFTLIQSRHVSVSLQLITIKPTCQGRVCILMNTDISSLRAELKSFEKDFKARHDRVPSVEDIKRAGFGTSRTIP